MRGQPTFAESIHAAPSVLPRGLGAAGVRDVLLINGTWRLISGATLRVWVACH